MTRTSEDFTGDRNSRVNAELHGIILCSDLSKWNQNTWTAFSHMCPSGPGGRGQCEGWGRWHLQVTYLACRQTEEGPVSQGGRRWWRIWLTAQNTSWWGRWVLLGGSHSGRGFLFSSEPAQLWPPWSMRGLQTGAVTCWKCLWTHLTADLHTPWELGEMQTQPQHCCSFFCSLRWILVQPICSLCWSPGSET